MQSVHKKEARLLLQTGVAWSVCMSVCLSVGHVREPCKNCWTDRDANCWVNSDGAKETCIRLGGRHSPRMERFVWFVRLVEKHWQFPLQLKGSFNIQYWITPRHAMPPFVKIIWPLVHFRPHRSYSWMLSIATDWVAWSFCPSLSVCLSVCGSRSWALQKTADPLEIAFEWVSRLGPRNHV